MKKIAKLGIILLVGLVLFVISYSFAFKGLTDRVIMLGLGIDFEPEAGEYEVSAEVIVPGAGSSQDGAAGSSGSRLVRGRGETVSLAINDIYQHYGKTPSLGECSIIVIGEQAAKSSDLRQLLGYFYASDAFKDGTVTVMCEGRASELFDVQTTMDSYVTFTLLSIVLNNSNTTTVPFTELNNIMEKQGTPSQCFYLNLIKTIKVSDDSEKQNEQSQKPAVKLDASTLGVFKANRFSGFLSEEATRGMCLMTKPKIFDIFAVESERKSLYLPEKTTVGLTQKSCGLEPELENGKATVTIKINSRVKRMRTDTLGELQGFQPYTYNEIDDDGLNQVKNQMTRLCLKALKESEEIDSDYLQIGTLFYKKYGKKWLEFKGDRNLFDIVQFKTDITVKN